MNRFCSMFRQLLKLCPRVEFPALGKRTYAGRHARGFPGGGPFGAMLFCQLGRAHSLRAIWGGLASCEGKRSHRGIPAPSRSTVAYANEHRPWQLDRAVFQELVARCQPRAQGRRQCRCKTQLVRLASTGIDRCAPRFEWAQFRRPTGAVKLHRLRDPDGYLPRVGVVPEGRRHAVRVARPLRLDPGTLRLLDRGDVDYAWFGRLTTEEVVFVTRLQANALYEGVERRQVPERSHVRRDEGIRLTGVAAATKCPPLLRRVEVEDPEKDDTLVVLTHQLPFGATTIAAIYKDRWQIELFFPALKQNRKIKTFGGDQRQCPEGPGLAGPARPAAAPGLATAGALRLVAVEPRGPAAPEPVHASRSVGLAGSPVRRAAADLGAPAGGVGPWLIRTAGCGA